MNFIEKIFEKLTLKFSFLNRSNSPSFKQKISSSHTGPVVEGDFNIHSGSEVKASDLEKMVLKVLHREFKHNGLNYLTISNLHKELEIKDGQYVGTLNSSKLITVDGNCYYINDDGIRYMDNLSLADIDMIILPAERKEKECIIELQNKKMDEAKTNRWKNSTK